MKIKKPNPDQVLLDKPCWVYKITVEKLKFNTWITRINDNYFEIRGIIKKFQINKHK